MASKPAAPETVPCYREPGIYHPPKRPQKPIQNDPLQALIPAAKTTLSQHTPTNLYKTPLRRSTLPGRPYLKLENLQITNSFKARGALNKLHYIRSGSGVVAASTGNHAIAIAHAAKVHGCSCTIFVPTCTTPAKRRRLVDNGVVVRVHGEDCLASEIAARRFAEAAEMIYVSPYNDLMVVAGQGTVGMELLEELDEGARSVYVTVGGGGLIAGIAAVVKPRGWRVVGCQPARSAVMLGCVEAGGVVEVAVGETLSDGSAGGIEEGCVTLGYCGEMVDVWIVVSEEEILKGMSLMEKEGYKVEGAAGVAVAAYLKDLERIGEGVIIICGGNVG